MKFLKYLYLLPLLCLPSLAGAATSIPEDSASAVILSYGRIGEEAYPDNDIATDQFLAHVGEIEKGGYNVMSLPAIIADLKEKKNLPPKTLAITFDGAYKSALLNAMPVLLEKKMPFTVFYAIGNSNDSPEYVSETDLKTLSAQEGVTLGVLPSSYERLSAAPEEEIRRQVNSARTAHRGITGAEVTLFAYPYGEYSKEYKKIISESGFDAAFGLHSGVVSAASDFYALPRFTMTEKYGDIERFNTVARAQAFPVHDIEPPDSFFHADTPVIGFSVPKTLTGSLNGISCFISGEPQPKVEIIDSRVELRPAEAFDGERVRVNCTMPGTVSPDDDTQLYRWFGMLLMKAETTD